MSEVILKALMQLFAIIARPESNTEDRRPIVESFLKEQLTIELVNEYLEFFDEYYDSYQKKQTLSEKRKKHTASSSVKVLMICTVINKELTHKQKIVVLIRIIEFCNSEGTISDQELEFISTVAETFNITQDEYLSLKAFILLSPSQLIDSSNILLIDSDEKFTHPRVKHYCVESLKGQIVVFYVQSANMYVFVFRGENELYLNGQLLHQNRVHALSTGSSIRNSKIKPIYYSDIISTFNFDKIKTKIVFEVNQLEYKFKNGAYGLNSVNFIEKAGKLVGIMGASGAGKSTLLNVLNGSAKPTSGEVLVNGINIHQESEKIEGLIGYVSQDDLLIEELTVFQNLYYNAKLCFSEYNQFRLYRIVLRLLKNLGLYEIKNMKVGSPLNKKISGGQRKRLNIALELIREPSILFLDEPTSGLSSRDSENILDLLKELTLKGKLVFVVIHQPSSDIFKMFDKLLILDTGGYLIYNGDPVDSIVYFKSKIGQANWNDSECSLCGNVNPEQIFNIVESRIIDEYGNITQTRKISPKEWFLHFKEFAKAEIRKSVFVRKIPEINFKIPNRWNQFKVFVQRDVLSKLANTQYLLINLLETPILALLLSYIIKFYNVDVGNEFGYTLIKNSNLAVYIFMSVIVALFVGLTVSAEEIIKDRKILKREQFLNLSRASYLLSKIAILLTLSAFQTFTFIIIGNSILEIKSMYWQYWLILFSTWSFANLLGLNISDTFKTSITIYILIPFLIIPQIILSGILVKFDKLNPQLSSPSSIPFFGEIITARWAYEALAVYQFKNNNYEVNLYPFEKEMSIAGFKKDYWLRSLDNKIINYERNRENKDRKSQIIDDLTLIRNEVKKELQSNNRQKLNTSIDSIYIDKISQHTIDELKVYFASLREFYIKRYNNANKLKDKYINDQERTEKGKDAFKALKRNHFNDNLAEFVTNSNEIEKIVEYKGELFQKSDPVFNDPESQFLKAHFYAPRKKFLGRYYDTFWVNLCIIWIMIVGLYFTLYFSAFKKILDISDHIKIKFKK